MFFYGMDPLYLILMLPVIAFTLWAQFAVKSNFKKFQQYSTKAGLTGAQIAKKILEKNGINDVKVELTGGWLSDHYAPTQKTLRLSNGVYDSNSISALGVAAHEAGHALQHHQGMLIMKIWLGLARPATVLSNMSIFLIIIGAAISATTRLQNPSMSHLAYYAALAGLLFFAAVVVFQIITLPLEFNASSRAKKLLLEYGFVTQDEIKGVSKVLTSAAMTYVAAAAAAIVQLLYFAIKLGLFRRR